MGTIALAATCHDKEARLAPALARHDTFLRGLFAGIAVNATDSTNRDVVAALHDTLAAAVMVHPQNEATIGRARRDSVRLALDIPADAILYCDLDHLLRWAEHAPEELRATLSAQPDVDVLVIGRSPRIFAAEPARLRDTEKLVNHVYTLMTGRDWDLMFAARRLSRAAAQEIVRNACEDSIANDVEWPLLAEHAGFRLGYAAADGLFYRTMEEFGAPADSGDASALNWIRRLEIAARHATVMRRFLRAPDRS